MALDERLLDVLVCPECRSALEHKERRHVLLCLGCGLAFPVRDGIPVMLVDEATRSRRGGDPR
ncbi:Trm112 family protein [Nitriliruptoraceae bacterium ZYF776]|nr:Trm112 family protein [Profundirhabdus halotolerans]